MSAAGCCLSYKKHFFYIKIDEKGLDEINGNFKNHPSHNRLRLLDDNDQKLR